MKPRMWIGRTLWIGGASLGIGIVSGLLSLVLSALGDSTAAEAVHGVTLVALTIFIGNFVALVVVLALNELQRSEPPPDRNASHGPGDP